MHGAVAQFTVVYLCFLSAIASEFLDPLEGCPLFLVLLNFLQHFFCDLWVAVEIIIQLLAKKLLIKPLPALALRLHFGAAEFGLCLRLKNGLGYLDRYGCSGRCGRPWVIILTKVLAYRFRFGFSRFVGIPPG